MSSTRRLVAAAVGGGLIGGAVGMGPFLMWSRDPSMSGGALSSGITQRVATAVGEHNHFVWQRGDKRPKRIILMRHGQTHGYSHTCDCQVAGLPVCALKPEMDRPLTEEGKLQALRAGVALKRIVGEETCTFYVSPYKSCKQSFSFVSGSFPNLDSCQYVEDPRLRNQDHGDWNLDTPPEKAKEFKQLSESLKFYYRWPDGESAADVYDRVSSFLETIFRKWKHPERPDNYVIITHSAIMEAFLMRWFHWDVATFERLRKYKNGQLAVLEKTDDASYKLVSPLPCDPPVPTGVKLIASNPVASTAT